MLRNSIPIFRLGLIVCLLGGGLYFYNEDYGKYVLGAGMVLVSAAIVLYVFFMFKRYGEKRRT